MVIQDGTGLPRLFWKLCRCAQSLYAIKVLCCHGMKKSLDSFTRQLYIGNLIPNPNP